MRKYPRREFLQSGIALSGASLIRPVSAATDSEERIVESQATGCFKFRSILEILNNPYAALARGDKAEANNFWDKESWTKTLQKARDEGYNAIVYFVHPFLTEG